MIKIFFGSKNIEKILFFLFVNETCYATQLQNHLQSALTPLQKALIQLEKAGVTKSHFEGKKRIYQLNPLYPLRWELEAFLKKAYILLPSQEKKQYCFLHTQNSGVQEKNKINRKKVLSSFWERLLNVQKLSLIAKSKQQKQKLIKTGKAEISAHLTSPFILTFEEKGSWFIDKCPDTNFSNTFRWTLDFNTFLITLEHLRYGMTRPVFLFNLTPVQSNKLVSVDAYLCEKDTYLGSVSWDLNQIIFQWRVIGPHKNDELIYYYS